MISKIYIVLLLIGCVVGSACGYGEWSLEQRIAVRFGATAKFKVSIVDDERNVVTNAMVSVGFGQQGNKQLGEVVSVMTDENGLAEVEGRTTGDNLWIKVEKEGYYSSRTNFNYIAVNSRHDVRFNRWQPYGEEIRMLLRGKHNPIKCHKQKGAGDYKMAYLGQWIGFDFEVGDWVVPFGLGVCADINVRINSDGKPSWGNRYISMEIEFVNRYDGGYYENTIPSSDFLYPYCANAKDFFATNRICVSREYKNGHLIEATPFKGKTMIARIRTEVNDKGDVVSCYYANIRFVLMEADEEGGAIFTIDYRLNPIPNDTNLECCDVRLSNNKSSYAISP